MARMITFDDVLIDPCFSNIKSRKDVDISSSLGNEKTRIQIPVVAANMDTVCGHEMASCLIKLGAMGCLHRFWTIQDNVFNLLKIKEETNKTPWVSVGISETEKNRTDALAKAGAEVVIVDVAHAAQIQVVDFYRWIKQSHPDVFVVVGNFGNAVSIDHFVHNLGFKPDAVKVGIGPGSACTTRIKTGCGVPQLSAIIDCARTGIPVIADGGMRTPGDIAKALAAGAKMVMLGGMLAGCEESPGEELIVDGNRYKTYRGSASKESYADQGKDWSCAEGESFKIPIKGSVVDIIKDIEGGLRSSMTYVGARNLIEFKKKAFFNTISSNTVKENRAHGKD